jgi:putative glutamine amidotransferase
MKTIAVSQRVDIVQTYGERRSAIDQRWVPFLLKSGLWPIFLPNDEQYARLLMKKGGVDGILLTGGNTLSCYGGDAPERDRVERFLLEHALKIGLPVLGVCRGMQVIQDYFGVELKRVAGHVASRHSLEVNPDARLASELGRLETVNAYHDYGAFHSTDSLIVSARSEDGVVMALEHRTLSVYGQMWHSEREAPYIVNEMKIFCKVFANKV